MAKYGRGASKTVKSAMRRRKRGTLKSIRPQGHEPQAGDCHRPQRGAARGWEGAAQERRPQAEEQRWT